jgi:Tfp pilus assembly protein FimV
VASAWRRRLGAVAVLVLLAFGLTVAIGRVTAGAQLADPVAGTATIAPGETLWDVAADTAPSGSDTRDQLGRIVELNALDGGDVAAWTVVLLPAR